MKRVLKVLGWVVAGLVVIAGGAYSWAWHVATERYTRHWDMAGHDFPIPFPLTDDERSALGAERVAAGAPASDPLGGVDLDRAAAERAAARGQHLVQSQLGCTSCHGADFGGGAIVDAAVVGRWVAPNLTSGRGGVTAGFSARDWDRAVRHGIRHTGLTSSMPSDEFVNLSDRELSDVVAYIHTVPPVDREMGTVRIGPVFAFMLATNPTALAAYGIDHARPHPAMPPPPAPSVELGEHIVAVCRGCHGPTLSGGKVAGDPNMPIVANLTPHETGLKGWTEADFFRALREGRRKDGAPIKDAMPWKAFGQMSDTEIRAVWAYLRTVPPKEKGQR